MKIYNSSLIDTGVLTIFQIILTPKFFIYRFLHEHTIFSHYDKKKDFWKFFGLNLASGGLAGGSTAVFVYPLDYARTRLATDIGKGATREFKGLGDVLMKTFKSDGVVGCYRGFYAYVGGIIIYRAGYFGLFDTAKMIHGKELSFMWAWAIAQVGFRERR